MKLARFYNNEHGYKTVGTKVLGRSGEYERISGFVDVKFPPMDCEAEYPGDTTKCIIEDCYGEFSVEVKKTDLNIYAMMDEVVIPALMASGYSQEVIDTYFEGFKK